jgi:hypothetical protein
MRRLLLGLALVACGSGTTEPSFPQGAFPILLGGRQTRECADRRCAPWELLGRLLCFDDTIPRQ